jgi:hypothetical protein
MLQYGRKSERGSKRMEKDREQIDDLIKRLAAVPERIAKHVTGWTLEQLQAVQDEQGWPVQAVLAHIRASDDIVASRIYMVLTRDNPPLTAYDERRWAEVTHYADLDFAASLIIFTLRRNELVGVLSRVEEQDWSRAGMHEERGPITLFQIVQGLLEHEEEHCQQIERIVVYSQ